MTNPGDSNKDRPIDAETHERLCARLLGELEGQDASNLDAACDDSEAMAAERARIAATIALVQDTYAAEPALSEEAMAEVMAAARQGSSSGSGAAPPVARVHQLPWWRNSGLRAAAAIAALVGGVFAVLEMGGGSSVENFDNVADVESVVPHTRRSAAAGESARGGELGQPVLEADGANRFLVPAAEAGVQRRQEGADGAATWDESRKVNKEARDPNGALVELGGSDAQERILDRTAQYEASSVTVLKGATSAPERQVATEKAPEELAPEGPARGRRGAPTGGLANPTESPAQDDGIVTDVTMGLEGMAAAGLDDGGSGKAGEGAAGPPSAGFFQDQKDSRVEGSTSGSDDFFLGRGVKKASGEANAPPVNDQLTVKAVDPGTASAGAGPGGGGGGGYRGPADTIVPNAKASPPGAASPAGPSSPGPAGPSSPGPAAADGISQDKARASRKDLERLASLGYFIGEEELETAKDGRHAPGSFFGDDAGEGDGGRQRRLELSEEQLQQLTSSYSDEFFRSCQPIGQEHPRDMYFRFYGDNPFEYAPQDPRSTFSVDVDTASYTLARNYLSRGILPEKAQVRTEEFLNYFDADLPAPTEDVFAITTEVAPSRFGGTPDRLMLRVGVRGKEISNEERDPLALTFVVDVSGSMREGDRLELVKHALRLLLTQLDARDRISLVAFSNEARVVLPMTPATERALIEAALHPLQPGGGTNAEAGLTVGYELAMTGIDPKVTSRVIFLSDGVANVGQTDQDRLTESVTRQREQGIYLNTVGVGMNNHNDVFLERLADQGDGVCDYVDDAASAKRALVDRFTGALVPIASDVKIQVVFDPSLVARYRLLGYENRAIADADFENDAVDAGEIGAGHQVVALYELDLAPQAAPLVAGQPMATVRLRWKEPKRTGQHPLEIQVSELEEPVAFPGARTPFGEASLGYRRSTLVAQFAEFLRRSTHAQGDSIQELIDEAKALAPVLNDGDFDEFLALVRRAEPMLVAEQIRVLQDELGMTMSEYRRLAYNRALLAELGQLQDRADLIEDIRDANQQIEGKIRDLIYQRLQDR